LRTSITTTPADAALAAIEKVGLKPSDDIRSSTDG
jgi:hypothetical protein